MSSGVTFLDRVEWSFLQAARRGNTQCLKNLKPVLEEIDYTFSKRLGKAEGSPLVEAARNGQLAAVQLLASFGANINHEAVHLEGCDTPLSAAARKGHAAVVDWLLQKRAIVDQKLATGETALVKSGLAGQPTCARLLMQNGANIQTAIECVVAGPPPSERKSRSHWISWLSFFDPRAAILVAELMPKNEVKTELLSEQVYFERIARLTETLLNAGTCEALRARAIRKYGPRMTEPIALLFLRGAEAYEVGLLAAHCPILGGREATERRWSLIRAPSPRPLTDLKNLSQDELRWRLLEASRAGDVECMTELIPLVGNVNYTRTKPGSPVFGSPLTEAARHGHVTAFKILVQAGAKPTDKATYLTSSTRCQFHSSTALAEAFNKGYEEIIFWLLDHYSFQESEINHALKRAIEAKLPLCVKGFVAKGADVNYREGRNTPLAQALCISIGTGRLDPIQLEIIEILLTAGVSRAIRTEVIKELGHLMHPEVVLLFLQSATLKEADLLRRYTFY